MGNSQVEEDLADKFLAGAAEGAQQSGNSGPRGSRPLPGPLYHHWHLTPPRWLC